MAIEKKFGYYPNNFNLEEFCVLYDLPANKVISILDLFINKPSGQEEERWVTLNAVLLKKKVGDIYKTILDALFDCEVIVINHSYEVGNHSKKYALLDKYLFANGFKKFSIEKISLNKSLVSKNNKIAQLKYLQDLKLPKINRTIELPKIVFNQRYRILIHWFQTGKLTIDYKKALLIIEKQKLKTQDPTKYLSYLVAVDMLRNKDYHLKSDINGRFYSSITNLPKILRCCLLYDGEQLAGVDVSNTQPLLLSELCNPIYLNQLKDQKNLEVNDRIFDEFLNHLNTNPQDLKEYKKLVEQGELYDSFTDISPGFTRKIVKENMVKIINDRGYNNTRSKKILREQLKQKFPTISMLLEVLKSVNHKYASSTLMTYEAKYFVRFFPEIFSYNSVNNNIPIFTIHDCFITTKSNIDYLESELKKYFMNNLTLKLPVKRENYI